MGEGGGGALSLFRFHLSPFPPKRLILRLYPGHMMVILGYRALALKLKLSAVKVYIPWLEH